MNEVKYAIRQLLKSPGFTAVTLLTLAVSIGATVAICSALQTTILDPLPVKDGDRLVSLESFNTTKERMRAGISPATIKQLRQHSLVFGDLAIFDAVLTRYRGGEFTEMVRGAKVSANFFALWQIPPALGRLFIAEEQKDGTEKVVVLSHLFWRTRLGSDPSIIGKTVEFDGGWIGAPYQRYTVIGVMPPHFVFPQRDLSFWMPRADPPGDSSESRNHGAFCRLGRDSTPNQAQAILEAISTRGAQNDPKTNEGWNMRLRPVTTLFADEATRQKLWTLFAVIGLVWLIACANVANLLLARGEGRQRELAMRVALGASQGRIVRQLLTESLVLAAAGGLCGLVLSQWGIAVLDTFLGGIRLKPLVLNSSLFGLAMALSVLTGLVFGLVPAWRASRPQLAGALQQTSPVVTQSRGGRWLLRGLIVTEVAFSVVILAGAGLMIRSVFQVLRVETGYDPRNLLMAVAVPSPEASRDLPVYNQFVHRLGENYAQLPGVQSVGIRTVGGDLKYTRDDADRAIHIRQEGCGLEERNLFTALRVPLIEGRFLARTDLKARTVVINQALARTLWPGRTAVGKRLRPVPGQDRSGPRNLQEGMLEVVGVVGDLRLDAGPASHHYENEPRPTLYRPCQDFYQNLHYDRFYIRSSTDPASMIRPLHAAINQADPGAADRNIQIVAEELYRSTQGRRFFTLYLTLFATVGLALASIGLYGLIAYSVHRRTRELGIRLALGSGRDVVLLLVMTDGLKLALCGLGLGLAGALFSSPLIQSQLYGVGPRDLATLAAISVVILLTAAGACVLPAFRATRINPMEALRAE